MNEHSPQYSRRAMMFGDMARGGRMQVYGVYRDGADTGITWKCLKKDRTSSWETEITCPGCLESYTDIKAAITAWEAAGMPEFAGASSQRPEEGSST